MTDKDDIVERIKATIAAYDGDYILEAYELTLEAAAEIVRLRAVITDLHGKISWLDGYEDINP